MIVDDVTNLNVWKSSGNPDNNVHNSFNVYPSLGDTYIDTDVPTFYRCEQEGTGNQIWKIISNEDEIESIISAIPQANWTQGSSGASDFIKNKPSLSTVATSGSYNDLSNKPTIPSAPSQSSASRSLNSAFQISTTRNSLVNYSVDIATSSSLISGQTGTVYLEIASDSGFTTNVQELGRFVNGNSVSLSLAITLTQTNTGTLSGFVPSSYYVRLRTQNNVSTPTFTYRSGQEVLI